MLNNKNYYTLTIIHNGVIIFSNKYDKSSFIEINDDTEYDMLDNDNDKIYTNKPYDVWLFFKNKFNNICDRESCWLKQKFIKGGIDKDLINSFAPKAPDSWKKNKNEWLSNYDIINVLKQYEEVYPCFEFIGTSFIDWNYKKDNKCITNELCNFKLQNKINNNKYKIAVIFNLDPHYKGGSHWVSLFINIKKGIIFYFDSAGDIIPDEIYNFVNCIIEQGKKLTPPIIFNFDQNYPLEHQYGDTECGVYSLYFILNMLKDKKSPYFFKTHPITDKEIEKYRKIYFNDDL